MEEVKQKKSTFEKVVIVFNVIAIIFMLGMILNSFFYRECSYVSMTMTEMQIQSFNSKFTTYEGIRLGSLVKTLIEIVNANNIENYLNNDDLVVSIYGQKIEGDEIKGYKFTGESSKKYKVQIIKTDNVVKKIIIYDEIEEIDEYEINNNTNNVEKENNVKYKLNWNSITTSIILYYLPVVNLYLIILICNKLNKERILNKYCGEECQKKLDKANTNKIIAIFIITIILSVINFSVFLSEYYLLTTAAKPIIYIYPEEETEVTVELGRKENLTCTYPLYEDKWEVIAKPDGTLIDEETGRTYYALYWEGINSKKYSNKLEEGFVVKGEDTIKFLEEKLEILGLNEKEAEEFIVYWLPKMQNNKYNYIRFQTIEEINENMPLEVTPVPDTLIRVMMEWKGLNKYIEVEEQQLEKVERKGYTVVEWGGTEIK